jgi:hypothetical protein
MSNRYSLSIFNWEISDTILWTELIFLAILKISRGQEPVWSASILLDNDPYEIIDMEGLAETFIGKLFSKEPNLTI